MSKADTIEFLTDAQRWNAFYQHGGRGIEIQFTVKPSWLGWVLVAATRQGICAIYLGDTADTLAGQLHQQFSQVQCRESDRTFEHWVEQALALIEMPQRGLTLPLDIQGTAFQQRVWQVLQDIPAGNTVSYSAIAQQIGNPKAVRAVASACAANQLAVAIPCHRVVGRDGALRGYRWGCDRKRALLEREATQLSQSALEELTQAIIPENLHNEIDHGAAMGNGI